MKSLLLAVAVLAATNTVKNISTNKVEEYLIPSPVLQVWPTYIKGVWWYVPGETGTNTNAVVDVKITSWENDGLLGTGFDRIPKTNREDDKGRKNKNKPQNRFRPCPCGPYQGQVMGAW